MDVSYLSYNRYISDPWFPTWGQFENCCIELLIMKFLQRFFNRKFNFFALCNAPPQKFSFWMINIICCRSEAKKRLINLDTHNNFRCTWKAWKRYLWNNNENWNQLPRICLISHFWKETVFQVWSNIEPHLRFHLLGNLQLVIFVCSRRLVHVLVNEPGTLLHCVSISEREREKNRADIVLFASN